MCFVLPVAGEAIASVRRREVRGGKIQPHMRLDAAAADGTNVLSSEQAEAEAKARAKWAPPGEGGEGGKIANFTVRQTDRPRTPCAPRLARVPRSAEQVSPADQNLDRCKLQGQGICILQ